MRLTEKGVLKVASSPRRKHGFFDGLAIGLSGLCMLHCLSVPVALALLPSLNVAGETSETFHIVAACLAFFACGMAIIGRLPSFNTSQKIRIGGTALLGIACLFGALLMRTQFAEVLVTVIGSLALIAAHVQNLRANPAL